jgi:hypothetical protein
LKTKKNLVNNTTTLLLDTSRVEYSTAKIRHYVGALTKNRHGKCWNTTTQNYNGRESNEGRTFHENWDAHRLLGNKIAMAMIMALCCELWTAQQDLFCAAPEITTESSERALKVGKSLQQMDAKMYGAHWCSHSYEQKQTLGKQVFDKTNGFVEYVECSKDGINSSFKICKAKEIPGYPN